MFLFQRLNVFRPQGDAQLSTRERLSYRNMSRVITSLVNGLQPRAEMPFAHVTNAQQRYPGDSVSSMCLRCSIQLVYPENSILHYHFELNNVTPDDGILWQGSMDSKLSGMTVQRERLQRYLTHAVTSRALDKTKSDWLNLLTMRFHHSYKEKRV